VCETDENYRRAVDTWSGIVGSPAPAVFTLNLPFTIGTIGFIFITNAYRDNVIYYVSLLGFCLIITPNRIGLIVFWGIAVVAHIEEMVGDETDCRKYELVSRSNIRRRMFNKRLSVFVLSGLPDVSFTTTIRVLFRPRTLFAIPPSIQVRPDFPIVSRYGFRISRYFSRAKN